MGEAKGKQTHLGGEGRWDRAEERGTYDQNVSYGVLKELIKKLKRKTKNGIKYSQKNQQQWFFKGRQKHNTSKYLPTWQLTVAIFIDGILKEMHSYG